MSSIHYFQRYTSRENAVTNNTLLLLSRIYEESWEAYETLINELAGLSDLDGLVRIGPRVTQQNRESSSVPDGSIRQQSFCVLIETKRNPLTPKKQLREVEDQLLRHLDGFQEEDIKVLLLLGASPPDKTGLEELREKIRQRDCSVRFNATDFRFLCDRARDLFQSHQHRILGIVDDYQDYCDSEDLLDRSDDMMYVVPCGDTWPLNEKYGVYYIPEDRFYQRHRYIGVYHDKEVTAVWKVESILEATMDDSGRLKTAIRDGEETRTFDDRIQNMILGGGPRTGHLFFCGEPAPTSFRKVSKGGIMRARYINLRETIGASQEEPLGSSKDVADALNGLRWE